MRLPLPGVHTSQFQLVGEPEMVTLFACNVPHIQTRGFHEIRIGLNVCIAAATVVVVELYAVEFAVAFCAMHCNTHWSFAVKGGVMFATLYCVPAVSPLTVSLIYRSCS